MWKEYSFSYIKNNRALSISVIAAALISALFLSFLCTLFYNMWVYNIDQTVLEEGGWEGRITDNLTGEDLLVIQNFGNVKKAVINKELSAEQETTVDIYFQNPRTIYQDIPLLIAQLGLEEDAASYHITLLSQYLIHNPEDKEPPLLLTFYLVILLMVSFALILIIRNSFALSMDARIHQFGIFSSIGATPRQIKVCLLQEAGALCIVPILLGNLLGTVLSFAALKAMDQIAANLPGRHDMVFCYHPLVFVITILAAALTILFSAWQPAAKLSRLTPLEAIRNTGGLQLKKKKHSPILSLVFSMEGELAGNALKAQKKALRTATLSLTLSFLGFMLVLCFFTLSDISTRHTYFERYQDAWDVMATIKNTTIENFELADELPKLSGVKDCTIYQKAEAVCAVLENNISRELSALGGPKAVAADHVIKANGSWTLKAPILILDDDSFQKYCEQIGITPRLDGTIILNQIWDSINSNFRYPNYIPFITEQQKTLSLQIKDNAKELISVPVTAYTREVPVLREEYDKYSLTQFVPLSLWKEIATQTDNQKSDIYVRILADEALSLSQLNSLEDEIGNLIGLNYELEIENRLQEKVTNDYMIWGYQVILGALCFLLAFIGAANVFSNTLGFLRHRKREFAQYMSIGMTPAEMRKMFFIEALVIAGRPLIITLPLTLALMGFMIQRSYLNPMEFIAEAPIAPAIAFSLFICGTVALAYYIGGKKVLRCNLSEALRDDSLR